MNLYLFEGSFRRGEKSYGLIREAARQYCKEFDLPYNVTKADIKREEKGKPYFDNLPIEFSLSHTGALWLCLVGKEKCGLDFQEIKECEFEKIAARYFSKEEQHYIKLWGSDGFFDLWVRKEAFCKFTGEGIFSDIPNIINEKGDIIDVVNHFEKQYFLTPVSISDEIKCAVCTESRPEIEFRILEREI